MDGWLDKFDDRQRDRKREVDTQIDRQMIGLPWWLNGKESICQAEDAGLIPGSGKLLGEGNGNPLQYSCLGNPWTEEPGWLQSMGLQKSLTQLSD